MLDSIPINNCKKKHRNISCPFISKRFISKHNENRSLIRKRRRKRENLATFDTVQKLLKIHYNRKNAGDVKFSSVLTLSSKNSERNLSEAKYEDGYDCVNDYYLGDLNAQYYMKYKNVNKDVEDFAKNNERIRRMVENSIIFKDNEIETRYQYKKYIKKLPELNLVSINSRIEDKVIVEKEGGIKDSKCIKLISLKQDAFDIKKFSRVKLSDVSFKYKVPIEKPKKEISERQKDVKQSNGLVDVL